MYYSAQTEQELVYGKNLVELAHRFGAPGVDRLVFSLTRQEEWNARGGDKEQTDGFADGSMVERCWGPSHLTTFLERPMEDRSRDTGAVTLIFICGPPHMMMDEATQFVRDETRDGSHVQIRCEKWW